MKQKIKLVRLFGVIIFRVESIYNHLTLRHNCVYNSQHLYNIQKLLSMHILRRNEISQRSCKQEFETFLRFLSSLK